MTTTSSTMFLFLRLLSLSSRNAGLVAETPLDQLRARGVVEFEFGVEFFLLIVGGPFDAVVFVDWGLGFSGGRDDAARLA